MLPWDQNFVGLDALGDEADDVGVQGAAPEGKELDDGVFVREREQPGQGCEDDVGRPGRVEAAIEVGLDQLVSPKERQPRQLPVVGVGRVEDEKIAALAILLEPRTPRRARRSDP